MNMYVASGARIGLLLGAMTLFAGACREHASDSVSADPAQRKDITRAAPVPPKPARVPKLHRAKAEACPRESTTAAHEKRYIAPGKKCSSNADCTERSGGRCNGSGSCAYDECHVDGDCTKGAVCECKEEASEGWRCMDADCRIDADCGGSGFCSPSYPISCGPFHGFTSYRCHTKDDDCLDDDDCKRDGWGYCAYSAEVKKWVCGHDRCKG